MSTTRTSPGCSISMTVWFRRWSMPLARALSLLALWELRNVSKTYGDGNQPVEVLHDISLTAEAGSITALVGRSGCGKTTLLNLVGAMDFPTSGAGLRSEEH